MSVAEIVPGARGALARYAEKLCDDRMQAYLAAPHDAREHANVEESVLAGGYAYRQIAELVQNAADAVVEGGDTAGRIVVVVDELGLWAANTGEPVDEAGVLALLNANTSGKRRGQIGRFGLGFKSLLKLGGTIAVLSRSVCLLFDPPACRARIRRLLDLADDSPAPGLRLAQACDWDEGLSMTPTADRFAWASTVVFAQVKSPDAAPRVIQEMADFPAEFLLFLPVDVELVLKGGEFERHLRRRSDEDGAVVIEDVSDPSKPAQRWRVFSRQVEITDPLAIEDATDVHARERVPLIWAAPVGRTREQAGRFFAFFPTATETRTLGILNAPWKLNSDRTALIRGAWNAALMEAAADFIFDNLELLAGDIEPGGVLDAYPRELQTTDEPAAPLVHALWRRLEAGARLPDCDEVFRPAVELRRAPLDQPDLGVMWSRLADDEACAGHLHPSCTASVARTARLGELTRRLNANPENAGAALLTRSDAAAWLEAAASQDPDGAVSVLELADRFAKAAPGHEWDRIRDRLRIIPDAGGMLRPAPELTLSGDGQGVMAQVHPRLTQGVATRSILEERFHLRDAAETDWDRLLESHADAARGLGDWTGVWKLLRRMPWDVLEETLDWVAIEVKTLDGWATPDRCFRFGGLITREDLEETSDQNRPYLSAWIVDEAFHRHDAAILGKLGVSETPSSDWDMIWTVPPETDPISQAWIKTWASTYKAAYHAELDYRPESGYLGPADFRLPAGWELLVLVGPEALVRVSAWMLDRCATSSATGAALRPVVFRHSTQKKWAVKAYPHPIWSLMLEVGEFDVGGVLIDAGSLLISTIAERGRLLPSLGAMLPGLEALQKAAAEYQSGRPAAEVWADWLLVAACERIAPNELSALYEQAGELGQVPETVAGPDGPVPLAGILVGRHARDVLQAEESGQLCLRLSPDVASLWVRNGARWFHEISEVHWTSGEAGSEGVRLTEVEPALTEVLTAAAQHDAAVLFVASLKSTVAGEDRALTWAVDSDRLLVDEPHYQRLGWRDRIALLLEGAGALAWVSDPNALTTITSGGVAARRRHVADGLDLPDRLLRALGGVRVLLDMFDPEVWSDLSGDDHRAAQVILTLLGPAVFAEPSIREALVTQGLEPPDRWGGETAASFIAEIGFPADFAASPGRRREPELFVSGPVEARALHDYQEAVLADLDDMLADTEGARRRRAVISLPTGAGKTRVAAQTAVTRTLAADSPNRLVVWIAQTDELCEQAVQCFRDLWATDGVRQDSLRVVRLWGGQSNPSPAEPHEPTVVVATIQTLSSRMNGDGVDWLSRPGLMVIDECHHALTPTYTNLFRWLKPNGNGETEPPVLGLSATPFRGRSEDETAALARRFDGRLIPAAQSGLFETLQEKGVLARFRYTRLDMEARFELTAEEERHLQTFKTLPESALERLGASRERNDRIIEAMAQSSERSALVFATSVRHARRLAARLNVLGVPAAAVSGETDRNSRRWFIRAFQNGDIRVLCNHSALTTGFDAPATDLIVIARPVFSPALYMQMVGRGLRGPLNGGKAACRILTVQDNLDLYSDQLAHHYFEQYYVN